MTVLDFEKIVPVKSEPFPFTELQTKWIEALESGEYRQGRSYLVRKGAYCCLGVLCEIAGLERVENPDGEFFTAKSLVSGGKALFAGLLPYALKKEVGLRDLHGGFAQVITGERGSLVDFNDCNPQVPFAEIAQYLRHDPWNVFAEPGEAPKAFRT
jgi:hypothetical protein